MRTRKNRLVTAIGLVLALSLAACAGSDDASARGDDAAVDGTSDTEASEAPQAELDDVVFGGSVTWLGQVPIMVAHEKGFFEEEGINLTYEVILASADRLSALTAGDVDFSNLGRSAVISSMAQGNDRFCYWANIDDSPGNDGLYAAPGIETVEDLRGKRVAANSSAKVTLTHILNDHGMTLDDIEYVDLPATDMALALRNGDVAAIDVWKPPLDAVMEAVPEGKLLAWDTDTSYYEEFGTAAAPDIVIMRRELAENDPDLAQRIARAVFRGVEFAQTEPEETAELIAHLFQQTPEETLEGMETFKYFGLDGYEEHMARHEAQAQDLAEWFESEGIIDSVPTVTEWACTDFVTQLDPADL